MDKVAVKPMVFFENLFWVGIFERSKEQKELEKEKRYSLKQQKRREKHKGR